MGQPIRINKPVKVLLTIDPKKRKVLLCKVFWEGIVWKITKNTFDRTEWLGHDHKLYVFTATAEEETGSDRGGKKVIGMELTLDNTALWDFRLRDVLYDD
jgi:hypothetical protein